MENFAFMFSLGKGGGRANDTTQGGRNNGNDTRGGRNDNNTGAPARARRPSLGSISLDGWDDASAHIGDDPSAPKLGVRFGTPTPGDRMAGEMAAHDNVFAIGGGGGAAHEQRLPGTIGIGAAPGHHATVVRAQRGGRWATGGPTKHRPASRHKGQDVLRNGDRHTKGRP